MRDQTEECRLTVLMKDRRKQARHVGRRQKDNDLGRRRVRQLVMRDQTEEMRDFLACAGKNRMSERLKTD